MTSRSRSPCRAASSALALVLDVNRESVVERQRREILLLQKQATLYFMKMAAMERCVQWGGWHSLDAIYRDNRDPTERESYEIDFAITCGDAIWHYALCEKCRSAHCAAPGQWHVDITNPLHAFCAHRHKEWPCADCPDPVESIGNRLECPRKRDSKGFRDAMIEMLKIARYNRH
jgi:hypothetical protein